MEQNRRVSTSSLKFCIILLRNIMHRINFSKTRLIYKYKYVSMYGNNNNITIVIATKLGNLLCLEQLILINIYQLAIKRAV